MMTNESINLKQYIIIPLDAKKSCMVLSAVFRTESILTTTYRSLWKQRNSVILKQYCVSYVDL